MALSWTLERTTMTRWNINALTLYGSLMGNMHTFNVLRPLPGLMAFLIQRRIRFTSPKCRFGWFWTLWKYWVLRLRTISILDPILPAALIRLFSCWSQHWYQLCFAFSQNVVLAKVVYVMTRWAYRLYAHFRYPLISPTI